MYVDNNTKLVHYIKNGKDHLDKLLEKYNGETIIIKNIPNIPNVKFSVNKNARLAVKFCIFTYILLFLYENDANFKLRGDLTVKEAQEYLINNDNLTEEELNVLNNEAFLNNVIPYCNNSNWTFDLEQKLKRAHFEYYNEKKETKSTGITYEITGYYNPKYPFTINLKDNLRGEFDSASSHEYIHFLQQYNYSYLKEASANIIRQEYFYGYKYDSYKNSVKNLELLIETIGPEPIWKMNFSGDTSEFENIIKTFLSKEDAKRLFKLFLSSANSSLDTHKDIESLIKILYENMYGTKFEDDIYIRNILEDNLYDRYYFNKELIEESTPFYIELIPKMPVFETRVLGKELEYDEYLSSENKKDISLYWSDITPVTEKIHPDQLKEWIQKGVIIPYEIFEIDWSDIDTILKHIREGYTPLCTNVYYYVDGKYYDLQTLEICPVDINCEYYEKEVYLPNIYEKFPNQIILDEKTYFEKKLKLKTEL